MENQKKKKRGTRKKTKKQKGEEKKREKRCCADFSHFKPILSLVVCYFVPYMVLYHNGILNRYTGLKSIFLMQV